MDLQQVNETTWYRGQASPDHKLDYQFVGKGHDQEGPGFYFSDSKEDAERYGKALVSGHVRVRKLASGTNPANPETIRQLILMAPDSHNTLLDWAEDPQKGLQIAMDAAIQQGSEKDSFQQVWYDFYLHEPAQYLKNLVQLGYDGHLATWTKGVQHLILYNPDAFRPGEPVTAADDTYTEIEFVCINPTIGGSDPKKVLNLYRELQKIEGLLPYRQDFDEHESMAVVILDKEREKELKQKIKKMASTHGVEIDLEKEIDGNDVNLILREELEYQITKSSNIKVSDDTEEYLSYDIDWTELAQNIQEWVDQADTETFLYFKHISKNLPEDLRVCDDTLYRGHSGTTEGYEKLMGGSKLKVKAGSWSLQDTEAAKFALGGNAYGDNSFKAVLQIKPKPNQVLLNLQGAITHPMLQAKLDDWTIQRIQDEGEVLLDEVTITKENIVPLKELAQEIGLDDHYEKLFEAGRVSADIVTDSPAEQWGRWDYNVTDRLKEINTAAKKTNLKFPTDDDMEDAWEILRFVFGFEEGDDYEQEDLEKLYQDWMDALNRAELERWPVREAAKKFSVYDHGRRIKGKALQNPIIVAKVGNDYTVLDGSHRLITKFENKEEYIDALIVPMPWAQELFAQESYTLARIGQATEYKFKWKKINHEDGFEIIVQDARNGEYVGNVSVEREFIDESDPWFFEPYRGEPFFEKIIEHPYVTDLRTLSVERDYQRQGVAKYIYNLALKEIKKRYPDDPIFLNASPLGGDIDLDDLIRFYQKAGFKVLKKYTQQDNAILWLDDPAKIKVVAATKADAESVIRKLRKILPASVKIELVGSLTRNKTGKDIDIKLQINPDKLTDDQYESEEPFWWELLEKAGFRPVDLEAVYDTEDGDQIGMETWEHGDLTVDLFPDWGVESSVTAIRKTKKYADEYPVYQFETEVINDIQHTRKGSAAELEELGQYRSGHGYTFLPARAELYLERYGVPDWIYSISSIYPERGTIHAVYVQKGRDLIQIWNYGNIRGEFPWKAFEAQANQKGLSVKRMHRGMIEDSHGYWLDDPEYLGKAEKTESRTNSTELQNLTWKDFKSYWSMNEIIEKDNAWDEFRDKIDDPETDRHYKKIFENRKAELMDLNWPIKVYRGLPKKSDHPHMGDNQFGVHWSVDPKLAQRFAGSTGTVWETEVTPDQIEWYHTILTRIPSDFYEQENELTLESGQEIEIRPYSGEGEAKRVMTVAGYELHKQPEMDPLDPTLPTEQLIRWVRENIYDVIEDEIEEDVAKFKKLYDEVSSQPNVTVYRALNLEAIDDVDFSKLGLSWAFDARENKYVRDSKIGSREKTYLFTGQINPKDIDWAKTFMALIHWPEQNECRLKRGANIKITQIDGQDIEVKKAAAGIEDTDYPYYHTSDHPDTPSVPKDLISKEGGRRGKLEPHGIFLFIKGEQVGTEGFNKRKYRWDAKLKPGTKLYQIFDLPDEVKKHVDFDKFMQHDRSSAEDYYSAKEDFIAWCRDHSEPVEKGNFYEWLEETGENWRALVLSVADPARLTEILKNAGVQALKDEQGFHIFQGEPQVVVLDPSVIEWGKREENVPDTEVYRLTSSGKDYKYHVTTADRWEKIKKEGLIPRKEKRGAGFENSPEGIYLFNTLIEAEEAVMNWLGDYLDADDEDGDDSILILRVDVSGISYEEDPELPLSAVIAKDPIPANKLKLILSKIEALTHPIEQEGMEFEDWMQYHDPIQEGVFQTEEQAKAWFRDREITMLNLFKRHGTNDLLLYRAFGFDTPEEKTKFIEALKNKKYQDGFKGLGVFWSLFHEGAKPYEGPGRYSATIQAQIPQDAVDWETTWLRLTDPFYASDEEEVRLKPGKPVKVLRVWDQDGQTVLWEPKTAHRMKSGFYFWEPSEDLYTESPQQDWQQNQRTMPQEPTTDWPGIALSKKESKVPEVLKRYILGEDSVPELKDLKKYQQIILPELKKLYPSGYITLYRGFADYAEPHELGEIFQDPKALVSFTESKSTALAIAKERSEDYPEQTGYAIKIEVPISAIYFHWKLDPIGREYSKEKEVLILPYGHEWKVIKTFTKKSVTSSKTYTADEVMDLWGTDQNFKDVAKNFRKSGDTLMSPVPELVAQYAEYQETWIDPLDIKPHDIKAWAEPMPDREEEQYAQKYAEVPAEDFPPIILHPNPSGPERWKLINGRHRTRAAFLRGSKVKALVPKDIIKSSRTIDIKHQNTYKDSVWTHSKTSRFASEPQNRNTNSLNKIKTLTSNNSGKNDTTVCAALLKSISPGKWVNEKLPEQIQSLKLPEFETTVILDFLKDPNHSDWDVEKVNEIEHQDGIIHRYLVNLSSEGFSLIIEASAPTPWSATEPDYMNASVIAVIWLDQQIIISSTTNWPPQMNNLQLARHWEQMAYGDWGEISDEEVQEALERVEHLYESDTVWTLQTLRVQDIEGHHSGHDASEEYIEEYRQRKAAGSDFPPIIVEHDEDHPGKYKTLDGQHRLFAAKKLGEQTIRAYVPDESADAVEAKTNPLDEKTLYRKWKKMYPLDNEGLRIQLGYSPVQVSDDDVVTEKQAKRWFEYRFKQVSRKLKESMEGNPSGTVTIYRCMGVEPSWLEELKNGKIKELGEHWTLDRELVVSLCGGYGGGRTSKDNIILVAQVPLAELDILSAFNPSWADEWEEWEVTPKKVNLIQVWDGYLENVLWDAGGIQIKASVDPLEQAWTEYKTKYNAGDYIGFFPPKESMLQEANQNWKPILDGSGYIYRAISLPEKNLDLNRPVGIFWTWNPDRAHAYWGDLSEDQWIAVLTAKVSPDAVDWLGTIEQEMSHQYSGEDEIRLKEGAAVELQEIEWIAPKDQNFRSEIENKKIKLTAAQHTTAEKVFEADEHEPYRYVWRVENQDGQGPYNAETAEELGGGELQNYWTDREHNSDTHPSPLHDDGFDELDLENIYGEGYGSRLFGFESIQQLKKWFNDKELKQLKELGFDVVKRKASDIWSSGRQVFFKPLDDYRQIVNASTESEFKRIAQWYLDKVFKCPDMPMPGFKITNRLDGTLGRARMEYTWARPIVEIHKSVLDNPESLERVIAHELIHVWQYTCVPEVQEYFKVARETGGRVTRDVAQRLKRIMNEYAGHGDNFHQWADRINKLKGPGFVTEKSDETLKTARNTKPFYIFLEKWDDGRIAYGVFVRPSPQIRQEMERRSEDRETKLFQTTDERFLQPTRLGPFGKGRFIPKDPEAIKILQDLWKNGKVVTANETNDHVSSSQASVWYHLTDNEKFKLDPQYAPEDNAIAIEDRSGRPGIYLTPNVETWVNGHGYWRPFVVEFKVDPSIKNEPGVHGRYGGEMFVPAASFDKLSIERIIPLDAYAREEFGSYGWIEESLQEEFDTGNPINTKEIYPFKSYRYSGPDVRDMSAEEVTKLKRQLKKVKGSVTVTAGRFKELDIERQEAEEKQMISKVSRDGRTATLYRTVSTYKFNEIDPMYPGSGVFGEGTYFAITPKDTEPYMSPEASDWNWLFRYEFSFKKPLILNSPKDIDLQHGGTTETINTDELQDQIGVNRLDTNELGDLARELGFDAVIMQGQVDGGPQVLVPTKTKPNYQITGISFITRDQDLVDDIVEATGAQYVPFNAFGDVIFKSLDQTQIDAIDGILDHYEDLRLGNEVTATKTKTEAALQFKSSPSLWNGRTRIEKGCTDRDKVYLATKGLKDFILTYLNIPDQELLEQIQEAKSDQDIPEEFFRRNPDLIYFDGLEFTAYRLSQYLQPTILKVLLAARSGSTLPEKFRIRLFSPVRDKEYLVKDLLQKGEKLIESSERTESKVANSFLNLADKAFKSMLDSGDISEYIKEIGEEFQEGGFDEEDEDLTQSEEELIAKYKKLRTNWQKHVKVLGNQITLYREILIDGEELSKLLGYIQYEKSEQDLFAVEQNIGIYWSYSKKGAQSYWGSGDHKVLIEAQVDVEDIDYGITISVNMLGQGDAEQEIRLSEGAKLKILNVWVDGKLQKNLKNKRARAMKSMRTTAHTVGTSEKIKIYDAEDLPPDVTVPLQHSPEHRWLEYKKPNDPEWEDKDLNYRLYNAQDIWYAVHNGQVVGHFGLNSDGYVETVFVDAEYRNQGIAEKLYLEAVEIMDEIHSDPQAQEPGGRAVWKKLKEKYPDRVELKKNKYTFYSEPHNLNDPAPSIR